MRNSPHHVLEDPLEIKRLIRENPWATIVSNMAAGLVATHYPVMLDDDTDRIVILSHVGRPDELLHERGRHEVRVIVQGPHGCIEPGWYESEEFVPTWNHVTAHLYGVPELLGDGENSPVLERLVDHFERPRPAPGRLDIDGNQARRVAKSTVGLRLVVTRFDARPGLSRNKPVAVVDRITRQLEHGERYANPALASKMRRARDS